MAFFKSRVNSIMVYGFLADVLGFVHFAYVSFVVIGQLLIMIGICLRWRWIRDLRFRVIHLAMILIVALESLGHLMCPLTTWENQLRVLAGQPEEGDSFVANLLNNVMFFNDIGYDHWIFKSSYVSFSALVVMTFVIAPPRRRCRISTPPPVSRRVFTTALLGTVGFIFINTALCMEDYKKSWDDRRENQYQEAMHGAVDAVKPMPPIKEDRLPVYFLAFSGLHFLGLACLCWALRPQSGQEESAR
ncbi:MAG TPA: DUF2784 domain-containing protein [Gemmataceae bacterium]|jgi:hypothetical protein|nr:DUF2784 domain-containing protein [Gemmataceae bacterium]